MNTPPEIGAAHVPATSPFATLLRFEAQRALSIRHAIAAAVASLIGVLMAFWMPTFPETVLRFFQRVFQLQDWAEIVVANDLTGIVFFVYWIGVLDVLGIYVVPREERYLDVYLSKPLTRRQYMLARTIPILITVVIVGAVAALMHALALAPAALDFPVQLFIGATLVTVAWTVCLVSVANLLVLAARDLYSAALIAFLVIAVAVLPGSVYMYRPDLFAEAPIARAILVFPMTLLWHGEFTMRWSLVLAASLLVISAGLVLLSARVLEAQARK